MKGEKISLPQFVISYETLLKFQELLYRLERASSPLPCDWVTVNICVLGYEISSYSNKFFINVQLLQHMSF